MDYMCFYCGKCIDGLVGIYYKHGDDYVCCECEEKYHKHADSEIASIKSEAEKWERIAMLAWDEKHKAVNEVGRLREALADARLALCDADDIERDCGCNDPLLRKKYNDAIDNIDKALDTSE